MKGQIPRKNAGLCMIVEYLIIKYSNRLTYCPRNEHVNYPLGTIILAVSDLKYWNHVERKSLFEHILAATPQII